MDHDQRFKTLIRTFFGLFLNLFFESWADRFDLGAIEWLETEILPDPPEGARHHLDLVAKLRAREPVAGLEGEAAEKWLALIHIEIESADRTTAIKPRLPRYYIHLRQRSGLPVLPIVIYLKVGLEGIGVDVYEERFGELCMLRFEYLYVGLPGLDGVQYVQGDNPLGMALAALMRIPPEQVAWLGAEALRRLSQAPLSDQEKYLLAECVEAYLPLEEEQRAEYARLLRGESYKEAQAMSQTIYQTTLEEGMQQGIEKGMRQGIEGMQNVLLMLGRRKFGQAGAEIEARVRSIHDRARLEQLSPRILDAQSWEDLLNGE